jgi:antitoxin ParD1/3/4
MEIHLRPELEAVVRKDVQNGAYGSVDEYVERAVSMLHEQEAWLAANRDEIAAKIEEGYRAAQRGELLEPDEVRMKRKKTTS